MRSVIEHNLDKGQLPVKVWYSGQFFRAERPQAGRYRQFYQVGIEAIGANDPELDAEVIAVAWRGFRAIGLKNFRLDITSLGDAQSRAAHKSDLLKFFETLNLDEATRARAAINPLRLFDDKRPEMQAAMKDAPRLLDYLSSESSAHFDRVKALLSEFGIPFVVNPQMVRGLDYYTGTTFEFVHEGLGAQSGIGGGGRYDGLMAQLGGADLSGIGFGIGVDRVVLAAGAEGLFSHDETMRTGVDLFLVALGESAKAQVSILLNSLRDQGISSDMAYGDRALKGAMKAADKSGARFSLVLGENELATGEATLKNLSNGSEQSVRIRDLGPTMLALSAQRRD